MNILLSPVGSTGDFNPMLKLGLRLREEGYKIYFCTTLDNIDALKKYGFDFYPINYNVKEIMTTKTYRELMDRLTNTLRETAFLQLEALKKAAVNADLIIGSTSLTVGPLISQAYHTPYYHVIHNINTYRSKYYPPMLIRNFRLPQWINTFCWSIYDLFYNNFHASIVKDLQLSLGLPPSRRFPRPGLILVADKEIISIPPDINREVIQVPYWSLDENTPLSEKVEDFLQDGKPALYMGFGSMGHSGNFFSNVMADIINEITLSMKMKLIISKGWSGLTPAQLNRHTLAIDYEPHHKLFSRLSGVIHHGGMGTLTTCIKAGIPQVIVPHIFDQFYNAHRLYSLKLAPGPVKSSRIKKDLISAVKQILDCKVYTENSLKFQKLFNQRDGIKEIMGKLCLLKKQ